MLRIILTLFAIIIVNIYLVGFLIPKMVSFDDDIIAFGGMIVYVLILILQVYYGVLKTSSMLIKGEKDESKD